MRGVEPAKNTIYCLNVYTHTHTHCGELLLLFHYYNVWLFFVLFLYFFSARTTPTFPPDRARARACCQLDRILNSAYSIIIYSMLVLYLKMGT